MLVPKAKLHLRPMGFDQHARKIQQFDHGWFAMAHRAVAVSANKPALGSCLFVLGFYTQPAHTRGAFPLLPPGVGVENGGFPNGVALAGLRPRRPWTRGAQRAGAPRQVTAPR